MPSLLHLSTSWGDIRVESAAGKIVSCDLPFLKAEPVSAFRLGRSRILTADKQDRAALESADAFLRGLFNGRKLRAPALAPPKSGPFILRAWKEMSRIPVGKTISYRALAKRAGSPRAFRAAGQACARNEIPLFIPCHRVLAEGGNLGGFSCGLAWKKLLLNSEGAAR